MARIFGLWLLSAALVAGCGDSASRSVRQPSGTDVSRLPPTTYERLSACLTQLGATVSADDDPLVSGSVSALRAVFPSATYRAQIAKDNRAAYFLAQDVISAAPDAGIGDPTQSVEWEANVVFFPQAGRQDGDARVAFAKCLGGY